jgi:hypothetical protein
MGFGNSFDDMQDAVNLSGGKIIKGVLGVVAAILIVFAAFNLGEYVDSGENVVIQSPVSGDLAWYTTAGLKWQGFGKVTRYPKSAQFWYSAAKDQGKTADQSIATGFNDGGRAWISGSVRYDYPGDDKNLTALHVKYGSPEAVDHALIRTVLERAVFMSGPTMSSAESYASRRQELPSIIEDQASNGIFMVKTRDEKVKDAITGTDKTVKIVELVKDDKAPNGIARSEHSPIAEFGMRLYNLSINDIRYSEAVMAQIQQQQKITMDIQTSIAEAKMSEQRTLTAEQNGKAAAAKAKWDQEAIKATAVTQAEQEFEVAVLENKKASQVKEQLIKEGEGEATKRRLLMQADNALAAKLEALVKISGFQANAIQNFKGNLVPQVVMGSNSGGVTSVQDMLTMMMMQNAKMLNLNLGSVGDHSGDKK